MAPAFTSAQRAALLALRHGALCRTPHGWVASGEDVQVLPNAVARWLLGERLLEPSPPAPPRGPSLATPSEYRLNERGRKAALEAAEQEEALWDAAALDAPLDAAPLLLLAPAPDSEELDYLLALPLGPAETALHRARARAVRSAADADPERFEFVQYRDEVVALPVTPRLAQEGLLPPDEPPYRLLPAGPDDAAGLGARRCSDRGVNYGRGWVQWFGGFGPEDPLIVAPRIGLDAFEGLLARAEAHARGG